MREMQELSAEPRQGTGKGHAFRTRTKGAVPGIVYGGKEAPEPVTVDYRELERHASKGTFLTTPFMLKYASERRNLLCLTIAMFISRRVEAGFLARLS